MFELQEVVDSLEFQGTTQTLLKEELPVLEEQGIDSVSFARNIHVAASTINGGDVHTPCVNDLCFSCVFDDYCYA